MSLLNENEMELVMEPMVSLGEKKVSKSLTMNEKRVMYGILSFLMIANRDGVLDDSKTQELMEHLSIFKTISEKKEFLSQEMFDMKMIEKDILKPMVLEYNNKKKQEKKEEKKKGKKEKGEEGVSSLPPSEKKKRVYAKKAKVEVVVSEEGDEPKEEKKAAPKKKAATKKKVAEAEVESESLLEVEEEEKKASPKKKAAAKKGKVEVEVEEGSPLKEEKKRGRKAKQQIVECNTEVNVNAGNSQEDQLADLVNQLTSMPVSVSVPVPVPILTLQHPEEIDLADLDEVLSNLEEGEVEEPNRVRVTTPRLPEVEVEVEVEVEKKVKEPKKKVVSKAKTSKK